MLNHCWCLGFLTALIYPKNKKKTVDGYSRYIVVAWIMKYNVRTHASKCAQFVVMTFSTPQLNPIDGRPEEITHHCGWFSGMVHESVWIESRTSVLRQYHEPSLSMQPLSISKPTFMQIGDLWSTWALCLYDSCPTLGEANDFCSSFNSPMFLAFQKDCSWTRPTYFIKPRVHGFLECLGSHLEALTSAIDILSSHSSHQAVAEGCPLAHWA